jgi:hypothetical protein
MIGPPRKAVHTLVRPRKLVHHVSHSNLQLHRTPINPTDTLRRTPNTGRRQHIGVYDLSLRRSLRRDMIMTVQSPTLTRPSRYGHSLGMITSTAVMLGGAVTAGTLERDGRSMVVEMRPGNIASAPSAGSGMGSGHTPPRRTLLGTPFGVRIANERSRNELLHLPLVHPMTLRRIVA